MPELPEVEVTRQRIAPLLVGRRIERVHTTAPSYFFLTRPERLRRALSGRTVGALERRGKYLLAELDDRSRLLLHLGMTGQLFAAGASSLRLLSAARRAALAPEEQASFRPDAHTHLRLSFADGGAEVFFRDVRKFGKVLWLRDGERHPRLERLGVDALGVTGELLFDATRGRQAAIKSALLDQALIAGVGNIYADEALFLAGVRPGRRAGKVTRSECLALAAAIRRVLRRSIETGGSSISDYVAPDGQDGAYQSERRVYARAGEPCSVCGTKIRRSVIGQRGTHHCPRCQH
jgi:formamidopyrimidine-DNA glycosylase